MSDADIVKRGLADPHYHQEALDVLARMEDERNRLKQDVKTWLSTQQRLAEENEQLRETVKSMLLEGDAEVERLRDQLGQADLLTDILSDKGLRLVEENEAIKAREVERLQAALTSVAVYRAEGDTSRDDRDVDWRLIALRLEDIARQALEGSTSEVRS